MPQDDYTITTDPSGALLQDIEYLTYINTDLSYIPQFNHSYVLTDDELNKQSEFFTPYSGPANMAYPGFMTYAPVRQSINVALDYIIIGNDQNISAWDDIKLFNIYRFQNNVAKTQGVAYNFSNNTIYVARVTTTSVGGSVTYSSEIRAVDILAQTDILVNISGSNTFGYIKGINFDMLNNLYVADYNNNNIVKIVFSDKYTGVGSIVANNFMGISGPNDITNDQLGNLYISNSNSNNVIKITSTGQASIFASGLNNPVQIQYDISNNIIYVANYGQPLSPTDVYISSISNGVVSNVYSNSEYYFYGLAIKPNAQGIYYTASLTNIDASTNTTFIGVLKYNNVGTNSAGYYVDAFNNQYGYSLQPSTSVALNSTKTKLYVAQYDAPWPQNYPLDPSYNYYPYGIIWDISLNNNPSYTPNIFYPKRPITDPSMNNPTSIAFDISNNLYVGNSVDNKILVIDTLANGAYLTISGVTTNEPTGLVFDNTGNLYFANYSSNTICKLRFSNALDASGVILPITGASIRLPTSLAIDTLNNILYIANYGLNNILSVNLNTYVATICNTIGSSIQGPSGLVYDSRRGLLYISNSVSNVINVIANNGATSTLSIRFERTSTPPQSSPIAPYVELIIPEGITIDSSNNILYIANYGNERDAVVKVNIDISSNVVYNSSKDSLSGANDVSMYYTNDPSANSYIFISADASYVPVITNIGNIVSYASDSYVKTKSSSCSVRPIVGVFGSRPPYYIYYRDSTSIRAVVPNLSTLFNPIYASGTTTGNITITGNTPDYRSALKIKFDVINDRFAPINFYVSDASNISITKVFINGNSSNIASYLTGVGTRLNINFNISGNIFRPGRFAFITTNIMYCIEQPSNSYSNVRVCKIELNLIRPAPFPAYRPTIVANFNNVVATNGTAGIDSSPEGYLYVIVTQQFGILQAIPYYYRITTDSSYTIGSIITYQDVLSSNLQYGKNVVYDTTDDSIVVACNSSIEKIYISFDFVCANPPRRIGEYTNTLYIADVINDIDPPIVDFSFNVYEHYIIIDPSNIPNNTATDISIYFINPSVLPNPTDTYYLLCGTTNPTKIADTFCNNCTYNKTKFLSGTYPTGLVYSNFSKYLYVALQNDTISRINPLGIVENDYIPKITGLKGPTSLVLDVSLNMYVLNVTGGFITKLTLADEIITADNTYYTNIATPICLTYDYITKKYLYLLSGKVPNMVITQIDIANPSNFKYLPIPFGALYNSNGLVIGAPTIYESYLYISNTDNFQVNSIKKFNLLDPSYNLTTELSGLSYKPYTLDYFNQHLYVSNKDLPSSITKIRVANQALGITASATQSWASNGISIPSGLTHDASDNLYIANTGTGPRNSRISKIYIEYFPFDNVVLANGACANAQIYDDTTKSYVNVYYNPTNPTTFPIPFPGPS